MASTSIGCGGASATCERSGVCRAHIEQGPVLERLGVPLAVVLGTYGVERHIVRFRGQRAHAGATPMDMRRDPVAAAARFLLEGRRIANEAESVTTVGTISAPGGIVTAVAPSASCHSTSATSTTQRCRRWWRTKGASERIAAKEGWRSNGPCSGRSGSAVSPRTDRFRRGCDPGYGRLRPSNAERALHDAAEMASAGIPTVMVFVQSLAGLSHTKEEDTRPEDLEASVQALDRLVSKTIDWVG